MTSDERFLRIYLGACEYQIYKSEQRGDFVLVQFFLSRKKDILSELEKFKNF